MCWRSNSGLEAVVAKATPVMEVVVLVLGLDRATVLEVMFFGG